MRIFLNWPTLSLLFVALYFQYPIVAEASNPTNPFPNQALGFSAPKCSEIVRTDEASGHSQDVVKHLKIIASVLSQYLPRGESERVIFDLYSHYSSVGAMLSAPPQELTFYGLDNRAADVMHSLHGLFNFMREEKILNREVISGWNDILDYLHARYRHNQMREEFAVLFLDRKNRLISIDILAEGTIDHVPVYPREIARLALLKQASAIVLVHNHPSGNPNPSDVDIAMTAKVVETMSAIDVIVHDHIIVGQDREVSMRNQGYM